MTTDSHPRPVGLNWRSNTNFIISTVAIGMFTDLFLYGLVVPILPFLLTDRLNIPQNEVQWWTSVLLAVFAGSSIFFSPIFGVLTDKLASRQLPFLFGLGALLASTTLLYLGQSIGILIVARILQGMSAAMVWSVGFALVMDTVGSEKLGVVIGTIFSFISVGELMAPVLGGIVYKKAGDGATFGMGFALLAVDFVMRLAVIEKKVARQYGEVDEETTECEQDHDVAEDTPLLANGKKAEAEQWIISGDRSTLIQKFPILYLLTNPRWVVAQSVSFMQAILLATFDATIPTEALDLFGFDSLKAGLLFIPLVVPYLILGSFAGRQVDRLGQRGPRIFATMGLGYLAMPLILLRIPHEGGTAEITKFCIILSMCGFGMSSISSPGLVESSYIVEQYHYHNKGFFGENGPYGQLYALTNMIFSLGLTLGPLIAGTLRDTIGYGNMNAVLASICLAASALSWTFLGERPKTTGS